MPPNNDLQFIDEEAGNEEKLDISPVGFLDQKDLPKLEESIAYKSAEILFRDTHKNLVEFLRPRDTDDANDGTFVATGNTPAIQFADAATKVAYFSMIIPPDLTLSSIVFIWSTPAASGNLRWQMGIDEGMDGDTPSARTTGGTNVSTAAKTTANQLSFTEVLNAGAGVDVTILRRGLWGIKFSRLGADAADTLSASCNLYGILIKYR